MGVKVRVCIGSACHLKGSYDVITALQNEIEERALEDEVGLAGIFCLGHCQDAVSVTVDDEVFSVDAAGAPEFFDREILTRL